jgi:hypothetical protein
MQDFLCYTKDSIEYWAARSNRENLTIRLADDTLLHSPSIMLIQYLLMGKTQAEMGKLLHVSPKTIEKRLAILTDRMSVFAPGHSHLRGSVTAIGLATFLMATLAYKTHINGRGIPLRW